MILEFTGIPNINAIYLPCLEASRAWIRVQFVKSHGDDNVEIDILDAESHMDWLDKPWMNTLEQLLNCPKEIQYYKEKLIDWYWDNYNEIYQRDPLDVFKSERDAV